MIESILVVDDEKAITDVCFMQLKAINSKLSVDTAYDVQEAKEKLRENSYDLVITDHMMPGLKGLDLIKSFHNDSEQYKHVPDYTVVITAFYESPNVFQSYVEEGCFDFVRKPFKMNIFKSLLKRMNQVYPEEFEPNVYVVCGAKGEAKDEMAAWVQKYIPRVSVVGKFSSRPHEPRDDIYKDTWPISQITDETRLSEIHWKSYGDKCCILRSADPVLQKGKDCDISIDAVLERGEDCIVAIGQIEGVDSLLDYYPNTKVFRLDASGKLISSAMKGRNEKRISMPKITSAKKKFDNSGLKTIKNVNYFDSAEELAKQFLFNRGGYLDMEPPLKKVE